MERRGRSCTKIIRKLLGKKLRCVISDGRVFFGAIYCINFENLILQGATIS